MLLRLTLQGLEHDFSNSLFIALTFYSTNSGNVPDAGTFEVWVWASSSTPLSITFLISTMGLKISYKASGRINSANAGKWKCVIRYLAPIRISVNDVAAIVLATGQSSCSPSLSPHPWSVWHEVVKWKSLSRARLFATPWTMQSMDFSRPEYWSGQPIPSPEDLPDPEIGGRFFTSWAITEALWSNVKLKHFEFVCVFHRLLV